MARAGSGLEPVVPIWDGGLAGTTLASLSCSSTFPLGESEYVRRLALRYSITPSDYHYFVASLWLVPLNSTCIKRLLLSKLGTWSHMVSLCPGSALGPVSATDSPGTLEMLDPELGPGFLPTNQHFNKISSDSDTFLSKGPILGAAVTLQHSTMTSSPAPSPTGSLSLGPCHQAPRPSLSDKRIHPASPSQPQVLPGSPLAPAASSPRYLLHPQSSGVFLTLTAAPQPPHPAWLAAALPSRTFQHLGNNLRIL